MELASGCSQNLPAIYHTMALQHLTIVLYNYPQPMSAALRGSAVRRVTTSQTGTTNGPGPDINQLLQGRLQRGPRKLRAGTTARQRRQAARLGQLPLRLRRPPPRSPKRNSTTSR